MGLFSRKKKAAPEPLPAIPMYPQVASSEPAHVDMPPAEKNVGPERPLPPVIPEVDRSVLSLPQREPAFLRQKREYPERASAAREEPSFEKPNFEQPSHLPIGREARGLALEGNKLHTETQEQQARSNMAQLKPQAVRPAAERMVQERAATEIVSDEKPLFIKLEKYREALAVLETLKAKIHELDEDLQKIEEVRAQEQAQLQSAKEGLTKVKESLLNVDKQLFEV